MCVCLYILSARSCCESVGCLYCRTSTTYTSPTLTSPTQSVMMIQDLNGLTQQVGSYTGTARTNVTIGQRYPPPLIPVRNVNGAQRYHSYPNSTADAVDLSSSHVSRHVTYYN